MTENFAQTWQDLADQLTADEVEQLEQLDPAGSVFTTALVQGLRTGAADTDHDGHVSVDDALARSAHRRQPCPHVHAPTSDRPRR